MSKARRLRKAAKKRSLYKLRGKKSPFQRMLENFAPIPHSPLTEQMIQFERDYRAIETSMRRFVNNEGVATIHVPFKANAPFFIGIDPARPGSDITVTCEFFDDMEVDTP